MMLDPDPTKLNCCGSYAHGLKQHLGGNEEAASIYYKRALKGKHPNAQIFLKWINEGVKVEHPFKGENVNSNNDSGGILTLLERSKGRPKMPAQKDRGLFIISELLQYNNGNNTHLIYSLIMTSHINAVGSSYDELRRSVSRVGPVHNALDQYGIPKPAALRERLSSDRPGWHSVDQVEFRQGKAHIFGAASGPVVPIISQVDVDVALWLAYFEGENPVSPRFSLDRAGDGTIPRRLDRKTFEPSWLAATPFGQSMYFADWLMKSFTMVDGLPSLTEPYISGACIDGWQAPAVMEAVGNATGDEKLPDGSLAPDGRLEIIVRGTKLSRATFRSKAIFTVTQYRIDYIDIFVASSLMKYENIGEESHRNRKHYRHDDPTTDPGAKADILNKHYDYVSELFPAFARVRYLLGLYSVFCQARRDGIEISKSERQRIEEVVKDFKQKYSLKYPDIEYSPKPFHKNGCCCGGGVSGRPDAAVVHVQSSAFYHQPEQIDYVVTSGGDTFPVPDGARGPFPIPSGVPGMLFNGGSGGKGMHEDVSQVWLLDSYRNRKARTYYKNNEGRKVDPFTGVEVDNSSPWAHIFHSRS